MKKNLDSMAQAAKDLAGKAQEKAGAGADAARDALEKIGELGQFSGEAAKTIADDLNELLPAIVRAGYRVQGMDIDMAVPPKIAVHCHLDSQIGESDRAALLGSLEGRRFAAGAVRALFQVVDLQKNLTPGALKLSDVILELGVTPGVKVRYRERDQGITA